MFIGNLIGWIIAGLIVGAFARLLVPGRQSIGIAMTIVLGIVGALVGGRPERSRSERALLRGGLPRPVGG